MESQTQHTLVVTEGPNVGRAYPLQGAVCTLGRSADNTVVLDSARVSRHHVQIRLLPTGAMIEDLGSTNGTWVNGRRLSEAVALASGDQIRVADFITVEYVTEEPGTVATVVSETPSSSTQVMEGSLSYQPLPPPPIPQDDAFAAFEAAPQLQPEIEPVAPAVAYEPPASSPVEDILPVRKRPRWLTILIFVLVVLICLCVALAVYLWFAPVTFWERVFDLLGIPMPTATLCIAALKPCPCSLP